MSQQEDILQSQPQAAPAQNQPQTAPLQSQPQAASTPRPTQAASLQGQPQAASTPRPAQAAPLQSQPQVASMPNPAQAAPLQGQPQVASTPRPAQAASIQNPVQTDKGKASSEEIQLIRYRMKKYKKRANAMTFLFLLVVAAAAFSVAAILIPYHKKAVQTSASYDADEIKIAELEQTLADTTAEKDNAVSSLDAMKTDLKNYGAAYDVDVRFMRKMFPDYIVTNGTKEFQFYPIDDTIPRHSYDWNLLSRNGNVVSYDDGERASSFGIDVSRYQGQIDWTKVKQAGVDYAIVRLGYRGYGKEGTIVLDDCYAQNMKGAASAGIKTGAYFFTQATTVEEAKEEAEFVLQHLKGYMLDYPVIFDTESVSEDARAENLSVQERTDIARAFCDTIAEAGYTPMIYASLNWYATALDLSQLTSYKKWYAGYELEPGFPYEFDIWQYSSKGRIDGIPNDVDLNMSFY